MRGAATCGPLELVAVPAVGWPGAAWAILGMATFQAAVLLLGLGLGAATDRRRGALAPPAADRREGLA